MSDWQDARTVVDGDERGDPMLCPEPGCVREFHSQVALDLHRKDHMTPKVPPGGAHEPGKLAPGGPFVCDAPGCGREFNRAQALGRHKVVHRNGKADPAKPAKAAPAPSPEPDEEEFDLGPAMEAAAKLFTAARSVVGIVTAYQVTGSGDTDEIEFALWRLGAAVADFEDVRP